MTSMHVKPYGLSVANNCLENNEVFGNGVIWNFM